MARRKKSNSAEVKQARRTNKPPPVPANFKLTSKRALEYWRVFTSARLTTDWKDAELNELARVCVNQLEIDDNCKLIKKQGKTVKSDKGGYKSHPLLATNLMLQNQCNMILNRLGIFGTDRSKLGKARSAPTLADKEKTSDKKLRLLA